MIVNGMQWGPEETTLDFFVWSGGTFPDSSSFTTNPITSLAFPTLTTVLGDFDTNSDTELVSVSVPSLSTVGNDIRMENMTAITAIDLPSLVAVTNNFTAYSCPALLSVSVPLLASVGGNIDIADDSPLTSIAYPALQTVGGEFIPGYAAHSLASISCPALISAGRVTLSDCPLLTTLSFPALTTVTGDVMIHDSALLASLAFPNFLPTDGVTLAFTNNALSATSVEHILARCVAAGVTACSIDASGGTNAGLASLSAQGQADYAALTTAGNGVTLNP